MAHLWQPADASWSPLSLHQAEWSLTPDRVSECATATAKPDPDGSSEAPHDSADLPPAAARLVRSSENGRDWVLLASSESAVRVNGQSLPLGMRVLADRDEIVLSEAGRSVRWFFSTEQLARVEPFPGSETVTRCPRCKQPIEREAPAVRCPDCGAWHHQIPEGHPPHRKRECWTYGERCGICAQPTALNTGYRWTPEGL